MFPAPPAFTGWGTFYEKLWFSGLDALAFAAPAAAQDAPPLAPKIIGPMQALVDQYWPGLKFVPAMANGYTDATFLGTVGIPTYGITPDADGNGLHGLNERIAGQSHTLAATIWSIWSGLTRTEGWHFVQSRDEAR